MALLQYLPARACLSAAATAALLCACAAPLPNAAQRAASAMIGQPIEVAERAFGAPKVGNPGNSMGDGLYMWDHTTYKPVSVFVQTGERYAGSEITGEQPVGIGPNGPVMGPVYEPQYQPVGHYEMRQGADYICDVIIKTDHSNRIKTAQVIGCGHSEHGVKP